MAVKSSIFIFTLVWTHTIGAKLKQPQAVVKSVGSKTASKMGSRPTEFSQSLKIFKPGEDQSNSIKPLNEFPVWAKWFRADWLKYDPNVSPGNYSLQCDPTLNLRGFTGDVSQFKSKVQNLFALCESEWKTGVDFSLASLLSTMLLRLDLQHHPLFSPIEFKLAQNRSVKGLIGLKPDAQSRPLVILRLGLFSNSSEFFPERALVMQLFDQSPFNLLILESTSGAEYIARNDSLSIGGVEEALQNYEILKLLRRQDSPIVSQIFSMHFVGVSFGGLGMLLTSLMDRQVKERLVSSYLGLCPLLETQNTFHALETKSIRRKLVNYWLTKRLAPAQNVFTKFAVKLDLDSLLLEFEHQQTPPAWFNSRNSLPNFLKSQDSYWNHNDYLQNFASPAAPILILASENDPIVPFQFNSGRLIELVQQIPENKMTTIKMEAGVHCSLPGSYDWYAMSVLMEKFILLSVPKATSVHRTWRLPLGLESSKFLSKAGFFPKIDWSIDLIQGVARARVFFSQSKQRRRWEKGLKFEGEFEIPLSETDFSNLPQIASTWTDQEKQALTLSTTRWLNHNVLWKVEGSELVAELYRW